MTGKQRSQRNRHFLFQSDLQSESKEDVDFTRLSFIVDWSRDRNPFTMFSNDG